MQADPSTQGFAGAGPSRVEPALPIPSSDMTRPDRGDTARLLAALKDMQERAPRGLKPLPPALAVRPRPSL